MNTQQYCHNTLTSIYGGNYNQVLSSKTPINPHLKQAIDKAHKEANNKTTFKKLVKQYAKLTASGIKECSYCQTILNNF